MSKKLSASHEPSIRASSLDARMSPSMPQVYTVSQFCEAYGISRNLFYRMLADGTGPKIMKLGRRTLVSFEAAETWRRHIEEQTSMKDWFWSPKEPELVEEDV